MKLPWKNKIIVKFFLPYLVIILILLTFFFFYSGAVVKKFYVSTLSEKMAQEAKVANRLLPTGLQGEALDRLCRDLARELNARITIIARNGEVLGDSDEPSVSMENHANRPEVMMALSAGSGNSIRYSTTVGYEMLYQAVLEQGGPGERIIRISVPLEAIEQVIGSMRQAILAGLMLISGLGLLLAYLFSYRLGRRVNRMVEFSQKVAEGEFPKESLPTMRNDELSILESNLNDANRSIQEKIKQIVTEKEKAESILRSMIEGVVVVDTQGKVILLNENARKMFKLSAEGSWRGATLMEISRHPDMKRLMDDTLAGRGSTEVTGREISLEDGSWFRVNTASLKDGEGRALGYILVFHDITKIRFLENVRADFVANVSHEMRTPLTAIRGYAETLLRTPPSSQHEAKKFLDIIHRHSERLGRLIDDLLTLSDLEMGRIQMSREHLRAADLIDNAVELFKEQVTKKDIKIIQVIEPQALTILGDQDRLQQLLINLIDNAIKYTPSGGQVQVAAKVAAPTEDRNRKMVELSVSDTGCGIPAKDLPRLAERFYRVDKARSRELGGTGLGLAIVKHIAQAHDGFLKVESEVEKGTSARVFLSLVQPAELRKENLPDDLLA